MAEPAEFDIITGDDGALSLELKGNYTVSGIGAVEPELRKQAGIFERVDMSGVTHIDTIGAWVALRSAGDAGRIVRASAEASRLIAQVAESKPEEGLPPEKHWRIVKLLSEFGGNVIYSATNMVRFISFLGEVMLALIPVLFMPWRLRWNALFLGFEQVGVRALAIVGLMSFLIGIVIAQQGAVQLREFGAEVFTINLIGRITFRELGVLMTAIMIAGRSASAFAAQLGTMKITEEIDAMRTIGVSPISALVLPRVIATILWMPLLAFYASIIAVIGGGLLCWLVLDIPPATFILRLREVTPMTDFYVGMIKAPVFGAIIALAGCFQGLQVKDNAEEVGLRTTAAVVQAIFLVIVLDAFFAVFFSSIGWK